jgi:hypothetical protein
MNQNQAFARGEIRMIRGKRIFLAALLVTAVASMGAGINPDEEFKLIRH